MTPRYKEQLEKKLKILNHPGEARRMMISWTVMARSPMILLLTWGHVDRK